MLDLIVGPMDALTAALAPLRPYAEVITPFHFPEVEAHLAMLAEPDGPLPVSVDVLKFLLTLFVSWPLAAMFAAIPSTLPAVKHGFSLTCGVLLAQFVFGFEWVHALTTATVVYVLLALGQRQAGLARARPLVVFAFMLVYLFAVHMYRVYHSYMVWKLDITSPLMLLTMKVGGGVFTRPFKFLTAPPSCESHRVPVFPRTPVAVVPSPHRGITIIMCGMIVGASCAVRRRGAAAPAVAVVVGKDTNLGR